MRTPHRLLLLAGLLAGLVAGTALAQARVHAADEQAAPAPGPNLRACELQVGDIVFTRIGAYPFRKVAEATGTWTNHVGIVLDVSGAASR